MDASFSQVYVCGTWRIDKRGIARVGGEPLMISSDKEIIILAGMTIIPKNPIIFHILNSVISDNSGFISINCLINIVVITENTFIG